jgi:alkylhydroperoxidase/carboxymuconolactone decarboxylase family protein YurZ
MILNWNEYMQQLATRIGEVGRTSPEIVRGYRALSDAGQKTDVLDGKIRELIALAVGVTLRCDGCITLQRIRRPPGVAISVNTSAALVYSARVLDAFHAKTEAVPAA